MANHESERAICPFYKEDGTKNTILCEGVFGCSCRHSFSNSKEKRKHAMQYCETFDYIECPLYAAIYKKYDDSETQEKQTVYPHTQSL